MLAADYPFLNILWSMIIFFAWVAWIWVLVMIVSDLFRRHDKSCMGKAVWLVFLILIPFVGVLAYLIANGNGMAQRNAEQYAYHFILKRESQRSLIVIANSPELQNFLIVHNLPII